MTSFVMLIVTLVVLGLCLYLIETFIPLSPPIKLVIRILVVLFSILLLLNWVGLINIPLRG